MTSLGRRIAPGVVPLLLYVAISLFAFRGLLRAPGTIGHNWDWVVAPDARVLAHASANQLQAWLPRELGTPISSYYFFILAEWLLLAPGLLGISGAILSRLILLGTTVGAAGSMFLLAREVIAANGSATPDWQPKTSRRVALFSAWLAGLFYGFSPLIFGELIGGAAGILISYAAAPLLLFGFARARRARGLPAWGWALFTGMVWSVCSVALQFWILDGLILLVYAAVSRPWRASIRALASSFGVFLLASAYWIVPVLVSSRDNVAGVAADRSDLNLVFGNLAGAVPNSFQAFLATGFFRPFFVWAMPGAVYEVWLAVIAAAAMGIFGTLVLAPELKRRPAVLMWPALVLLFLLLSTGLRSPLPGAVAWLYLNVPGFTLFRSPQRWMLGLTLCYAACLALVANYWLRRAAGAASRGRRAGLPIAACALLALWLNPLWTGDLGGQRLNSYGGGNFLSTFQWSPAIRAWQDLLFADTQPDRALFLPLGQSVEYLPNPYQPEGQGGDPLVNYSPKPTMTMEGATGSAAQFTQALAARAYLGQDGDRFTRLLSLLSIRYVGLRSDARPIFGAGATSWNERRTEQYLNRLPDLTAVPFDAGGPETIRAFRTAALLPHLYATSDLILVDGDFDALLAGLGSVSMSDAPGFVTFDTAAGEVAPKIAWQEMFLGPDATLRLFGRLPTAAGDAGLHLGGASYVFAGFVSGDEPPLEGAKPASVTGPWYHLTLAGAAFAAPMEAPLAEISGTTDYRLSIAAPSEPRLLVLGESWDPGWILDASAGVDAVKVKANGYANGWLMLPRGSPPGSPIGVHIRFPAQGVLELSLWLSGLSMGALTAGLLVVSAVRQSRRRGAH